MDNECQPIECQPITPDVPNGSNSSESGLRNNGLVLRPVAENESGTGLPYAPADWPKPGDTWGWKVGNRTNFSGFWQDRYLYLPIRLQKSLQKRRFASRPAVKRFLEEEFPDADIDAFFSSFSWRIPAIDLAGAKGETRISGIKSKGKVSEPSQSDLKVETVDCKAGNWMCRLQLKASHYSLPAMTCDICCSEAGFCRDCCCILCCEIVDWAFGAYSFIRCEAKVNENYICGHVAHIECALRSNMAGTIGGNGGLDVEYYCRRCDKRSDLIVHVNKLLQICESLESRDDIEKIINVGLRILDGSEQERSKRLLRYIELALTKLKSGMRLEDVWKLENNSSVYAGDILYSASNGTLYRSMEIATSQSQMNFATPSKSKDIQHTQQLITKNTLIESSELEERIKKALQGLRGSQNYEYRIAEDSLSAQKDFILELYQRLEVERSELAKLTSSAKDCNADALISSIMNKAALIKREVIKLKEMEEVAKGFGRVPKVVLKEHFGLPIA